MGRWVHWISLTSGESGSEGVGELPLDRESVIAYLRSLRDSGIATWRRHQATRALEIYQATVLRNSMVDFRPNRNKLQAIARTEKRTGGVMCIESCRALLYLPAIDQPGPAWWADVPANGSFGKRPFELSHRPSRMLDFRLPPTRLPNGIRGLWREGRTV